MKPGGTTGQTMNRIRRPEDIQPQDYGLLPDTASLQGAAGAGVFRQMLRIRRVEERIGVRYAEQEMRCPTHLTIGQEAPPAAILRLISRSTRAA